MSSRSIGVMKLLSMRCVDRVRQHVGLVLDVLDLPHQLGGAVRLGEELIEERRRRLEMFRELVEEVEELLVARDEAIQHGGVRRVGMRAKLPVRYTSGKLRHPPLQSRQVESPVRMLDRADRVSLRHEPPILEQLDQDHAGHEAAHVRPDRHAARDVRPHRQSCGSPVRTCSANHQSSTSQAGMAMTLKKMMKMKSMLTRTRG